MPWGNPPCIEAPRAVLGGLLALGLAGCAALSPEAPPSQPASVARPAFEVFAPDRRVRVQAGSAEAGLAYAARVADLLDAAVARVEAVHGLPFLKPPRIDLCATPDCFGDLVPGQGFVAAVLPGGRLVLSPRLFGPEAARLPAILRHELSHLHLGQRLGHYTPWLPVWFHEGLATLVADGGGAEYASDLEAAGARNEGRRVDFTRLDVPGRRHRAADFNLDIHTFYRQSWRFVEYLQRRDPRAFAAMLGAIQNQVDITISVADAYNAGLDRLEAEFMDAAGR